MGPHPDRIHYQNRTSCIQVDLLVIHNVHSVNAVLDPSGNYDVTYSTSPTAHATDDWTSAGTLLSVSTYFVKVIEYPEFCMAYAEHRDVVEVSACAGQNEDFSIAVLLYFFYVLLILLPGVVYLIS